MTTSATSYPTVRPRRSVLYMPGSNPRAMEKARSLPVDGIILDLEDAVGPDGKTQARDQVVEAVKAGGFGSREVIVRINGLDTPWHVDDLTAVAHAQPDAVLIPKVTSPQQLESIGHRLLDMQIDQRTRLWAMIETPLALFNVLAIASEGRDAEARLACLVMGTNDLAKETRARLVPGREPMVPWLAICVAAARVYGIDILDGVFNDLNDPDGLERECLQARNMGFDGKTLIHPNQIGACNAAFSPTFDEIAQAKRVIAAFEEPENRDKGVVQVDGRMVERMHADMARRTLAIAEAIEERS
jgi:citrate lyase subunit beta/citryl-CoA lyase